MPRFDKLPTVPSVFFNSFRFNILNHQVKLDQEDKLGVGHEIELYGCLHGELTQICDDEQEISDVVLDDMALAISNLVNTQEENDYTQAEKQIIYLNQLDLETRLALVEQIPMYEELLIVFPELYNLETFVELLLILRDNPNDPISLREYERFNEDIQDVLDNDYPRFREPAHYVRRSRNLERQEDTQCDKKKDKHHKKHHKKSGDKHKRKHKC